MEKKLDELLLRASREPLEDTSKLPVVIHCDSEAIPAVERQVDALGGRVRGTLTRLGAVAAWLPISGLEILAELPAVHALHMEQEYTIAH